MSIFTRLTPLFVFLMGLSTLAMGQTQNAETTPPLTCGINWLFPPLPLPDSESKTQIEANQLRQPDQFQIQLIGKVRLSEPGLVVLAEQIEYDRDRQAMRLKGAIQLHHQTLLLSSESALYYRPEQTAQLNNLSYQLKPSGYHGKASQLNFDGGQQISQLTQATFTTCSIDNPAWQLNFNRLEINQNTRRLYGHHGYLSVKGVPLLYSPYINVPLDQRATGFLFPTFGSLKPAALSQSQMFVAIPFYWVIADNYDATFNFLFLQQRGLLLDTEWRYLQRQHQGEIQLALTQDQLVKKQGLAYLDPQGQDQQTVANDTRWRVNMQGQQNWNAQLRSQVQWHEVSDPDFYNDFPLGLSQASLNLGSQSQVLERQARLNFQQSNFNAHIQHHGYLPLRNGEQTILEKSPEIGINWQQNWGKLKTELYAEATEFKRYSGFNNFVDAGYVRAQALGNALTDDPYQHQGQRVIIQPRLTYRIDQPYGFAQANIQANYRHYQLTNAANNSNSDSLVMQYALRGGLVFERDLSFRDTAFIQTLEPQVQWLYVPYEDQSHLSLFDSGNNSLDFSNLFQLNRYSGFDRIGDTQQISLALSNRLFNQQGQALGELALGQIFYLKDRRVSLNQQQIDSTKRSDYFVKLSSHFKKLDIASTSQFDPNSLKLNQTLNRLKWNAWQPLDLLAIHQGLALNDAKQRQQNLASGIILKLSSDWQVASYLNYDLETSSYREFSAGLRYDSCCWASELMFKQEQIADGRYNYSVKYVIEFKGLSSIGKPMTDQIQQSLNF